MLLEHIIGERREREKERKQSNELETSGKERSFVRRDLIKEFCAKVSVIFCSLEISNVCYD